MFYQLTAAKINDLSELTFTEREMSEPGLAYRQAGLGGLIGLGDFEPQKLCATFKLHLLCCKITALPYYKSFTMIFFFS